MKPLIRWTIGKTTKNGIKCLKYSIKKMKDHFKDNFNYILCYNDINFNEIKEIRIEKIDQNNWEVNSVKSGAWKLVPGRLNPNGYEIWIDNDLVIENKPYFLEKFIDTNQYFICEGLFGLYGKYNNLISSEIKMCSCFFGLPPEKELEIEFKKNSFLDHYDEQGLVSYICNKNNAFLIGFDYISNCETTFNQSKYGYHFVGLNKNNDHKSWHSFIREKIKI